jgi:ABC-type branched-subunit amino acid transport system substrate-binding protein
MTTAYRFTANLQNVAVLGQVCSFGFARALPIYENAGLLVVTGSATNDALPSSGRMVFDRTVVDDDGFEAWYAVVSQLPSELAWQQAYTDEFGAGPSDFADLYYDAASLVISDLEATSTVNTGGNLILNRTALARSVRNTAGYPGVSCAITLDPATGNRLDDPAALSKCAIG